MKKTELKEFLDEKVVLYNNPKFIESDPIQIPHQYKLKEDIEIAAFLTATISWGNRKMISKYGWWPQRNVAARREGKMVVDHCRGAT